MSRQFLGPRSLPAVSALLGGILYFALTAMQVFVSTGAEAKTPGKTYCFNRTCHRVLTLGETQAAVGKRTSVIASYYSDCRVDRFNPCGLTSSGAKFRPSRADNAASPIYPNGTRLLVWNPANKRAAVVRIDNAGPYWGNRKLDLSNAAAQKLGFRHRGVARLVVQVLSAPTPAQARYRAHRTYAPVRGYIGRFPSLANAWQMLNPPPGSVAELALPVKNVYRTERRIWLARMVGTAPISIALATPPKVRLPARLAGEPYAGAPKPVAKPSRIAALPKETPRVQKRRTTKRKEAARSRNKPRATKAAATRAARTTKRSARPGTRGRNTPTTQAPNRGQAQKPAATAAASTGETKPPGATATETGQATVTPRPKMRWRPDILSINSRGA